MSTDVPIYVYIVNIGHDNDIYILFFAPKIVSVISAPLHYQQQLQIIEFYVWRHF